YPRQSSLRSNQGGGHAPSPGRGPRCGSCSRRSDPGPGGRRGWSGMTSVPGELRFGEATVRRAATLPPAAWLYFGAVVAATLGAAIPLGRQIHPDGSAWTRFLVLSACAAVAQLFVVRTVRDQSYHTSTA